MRTCTSFHFQIRGANMMSGSHIPAGWRSLLTGTLLGAAIMAFAAWVSAESKPADNAKNPIGDKFWPSEFGPDDQRGAANRITPLKSVRAAQLVKQGRTFQLGRLYEQGMPIPGKRHFSLTIPGLP